jgi:hypothetical protein
VRQRKDTRTTELQADLQRTGTAVFHGHRKDDEWVVTVRYQRGQAMVERRIPLRLDLCNHSPDGFAWGYQGSGPAQLALSLLSMASIDVVALDYHTQFTAEVTARWSSQTEWSITLLDLRDWIKSAQARRHYGLSGISEFD